MTQSENIAELAKALNKFKSEHPPVSMDETVEVKDRAGKFLYSYQFASLPGIKKEIEPFLTSNGLVVTQFPDEGNKLITVLMHTSGQFMSGCMDLNELNTLDKDGIRQNSGPQDYGSLLTFARRYAYYAILGLIGDSSSDKSKPKARAEGTNQQQPKPAANAQNTSSAIELPWLNKVDLKGATKPEWGEAIKHMTEGPGDIDTLLLKYRINKDNKNELLRAKELYVSVDKLTHLTEDVRKKVNQATSIKELEGLYSMYVGLQADPDFIEIMGMKKKVLAFPKPTQQPTTPQLNLTH